MSGMFQRVLNYVANELLVEKLSNSPTFQRFAIRTDAWFRQNFGKAVDAAKNASGKQAAAGEAGAKAAGEAGANAKGGGGPGDVKDATEEVTAFMKSFSDEMSRAFGVGSKGGPGPPPPPKQ
mmetsp:Transcript_20557/g.69918  ORF Transcript_20557/g.69918 Transcript_20557/m.69918 type:complete len:122 (-) Transcript_20557:77-442(-)